MVEDITVVVTGQTGTVGILEVLGVDGLAPEVQRGGLRHLKDLEAALRDLTSPHSHLGHHLPVLLPVTASHLWENPVLLKKKQDKKMKVLISRQVLQMTNRVMSIKMHLTLLNQ